MQFLEDLKYGFSGIYKKIWIRHIEPSYAPRIELVALNAPERCSNVV